MVEPGRIAQIKGANGAGKTTLIRALTGLHEPTAGEILWDGVAIGASRREYHQALSYVGHSLGMKGDLSPLENLHFYARSRGVALTDATALAALKQLEVLHRATVDSRKLSSGQQRRAALARLLAVPTPLWILDEPLTGIDADGQALVAALFQNHVEQGGTVIFTAHHPVDCDPARLLEVNL